MENLPYMYWFHGGKPSRTRVYTLHIFDYSSYAKDYKIDKYGGNFDVKASAKSMREVRYNVPHHMIGKLMHVSVSSKRSFQFSPYNWLRYRWLKYKRKQISCK